jgi:hypothetical protein
MPERLRADHPSVGEDGLDLLVMRWIVAYAMAAGSSGAITSNATVVASNVSSSTPRSVSFVVNAYSADIHVTGAAREDLVGEVGAPRRHAPRQSRRRSRWQG